MENVIEFFYKAHRSFNVFIIEAVENSNLGLIEIILDKYQKDNKTIVFLAEVLVKQNKISIIR